MDIVNQVLVLFLLILCGFVAAKSKCIREEGVHGLNSVLVNFSLPCMAIAKLQVDASPELMQDIVHMAILTAVAMLGCAAVVWFGICRHESPLRRAALSGMALIPNSGFMGLPLIAAAFGEDKMIYGIIYVGVSNIITWSVGVALYDKKALSWRRIFLIPTLVTSVLGLILFVAEVRLPSVLLDTLEMLGDTTTPLAMFIIGTHLVGLRLRDMRDAKLLLICGLRLIVFPLAVYGLCLLLGVSQWTSGCMMLLTAMPCGSVLVIQAEDYHGDPALASRGVAISTFLSIATIPLLLLLL